MSETELPKTTAELREELRYAKEQMEKTPTYSNALAVQHATHAFKEAVKESRASFFSLNGGSGFHDLSPLEISVSALKEIVDRANSLQEQWGHYWSGTDLAPFMFLGKVAKEALKDMGE